MLATRAMKRLAAQICLLLVSTATFARDDGRHAKSPLKPLTACFDRPLRLARN